MISSKFALIFILLNVLTLFGLTGVTEAVLLSGWIFPNPAEVVLIGMFFLGVIGVQIAAHTGILMPPHNPFFGKRSISSPPKWFERGPQPSRMITIQEFRTIERGLKSLRRIDRNDCFIKLVCEMNQDLVTGKETSNSRTAQLLKVFRLREFMRPQPAHKSETIWDIYEQATKPELMNCSKKYKSCPLSHKQLQYEAKVGESF
ncbi:uncharacterized protein LOC110851650 [Folsomia candida]|uniref:Uncharacterized protein n=1 Tax=Folsomia candida TaxID=158441 RepID=A0A226E496_FOLCA|nr:uncharacterized protein LOC110851650 [Folsomia candida]OXA51854.1 hypothetical protein Fcan01_13866 [Folsomia candida]